MSTRKTHLSNQK